MRLLRRIHDHELDRVLTGSSARDDLQAVAGFFRELKLDLAEAPAPANASAHLAQIFAAAHEGWPQEAPPVQPVTQGARFSLVPLRAVLAAAIALSIGVFGGAAYAGALPRGVQTKVSEIAHHVGVSLPYSRHDIERSHPRPPNQTPVPAGEQPPALLPAGHSGEGDQPQGDQPQGDQPQGDQPQGDQPQGDQPQGDRSQGQAPNSTRGQGDNGQSGDQGAADVTTNTTAATGTTADQGSQGGGSDNSADGGGNQPDSGSSS